MIGLPEALAVATIALVTFFSAIHWVITGQVTAALIVSAALFATWLGATGCALAIQFASRYTADRDGWTE